MKEIIKTTGCCPEKTPESIYEKLVEIKRALICAENNLRNSQTFIDGEDRMVTYEEGAEGTSTIEGVIFEIGVISEIILDRSCNLQIKLY